METSSQNAFTEDLSRSRARSAFRSTEEQSLERETIEAGGETKPLIGGMGWWFMFTLTIIVDVVGIFFTLTLFLAALAVIFGWVMNAAIWVYYYKNGIGMVDKKVGKYIAAYLTSFIFETTPGINIVPALSIMFAVVRVLENAERKHHNDKVFRGIMRGLEYAESHRLGL